MINLCKNERDVDILIPAYYNFLGHHTIFLNKDIDSLLLKCISLNCGTKIHPILSNHNLLLYYPHQTIFNKLIENYIQQKSTDGLQDLLKILL